MALANGRFRDSGFVSDMNSAEAIGEMRSAGSYPELCLASSSFAQSGGATPEEFLTEIHAGCSGTFARVMASPVRLSAPAYTCSTAMLLNLTGRILTGAVAWRPAGLEGRSKSRTKGGLGARRHTVSTSTSMRNSSSRFVQRSKHVDRQRRNPSCNLPRCRSCDTRHARGLTNLKSVTNWPGGNFESGGFKIVAPAALPGA